jgi:hypothetical protein
VGTVFDDTDAPGPCERQDIGQALREAKRVLSDDCLRGRRERGAKRVKIDPIVSLDIDVDGPGTAVNNGEGDDSASEPRKDHLVPFTDPHGLENGPERVSATREGHNMADTERCGQAGFKALDRVTVTSSCAKEHPQQIGQKGPPTHAVDARVTGVNLPPMGS